MNESYYKKYGYETSLHYRGISHDNIMPNRYPYLYQARPVNTLYSSCRRRATKPYPYTDRPPAEIPSCAPYGFSYQNIVDACGLRSPQEEYVGWWTQDGYKY